MGAATSGRVGADSRPPLTKVGEDSRTGAPKKEPVKPADKSSEKAAEAAEDATPLALAAAFHLAAREQPGAAAWYQSQQQKVAQAVTLGNTTEAAYYLNNLAHSSTVHPELREAARRWVKAH